MKICNLGRKVNEEIYSLINKCSTLLRGNLALGLDQVCFENLYASDAFVLMLAFIMLLLQLYMF